MQLRLNVVPEHSKDKVEPGAEACGENRKAVNNLPVKVAKETEEVVHWQKTHEVPARHWV